MKRFFEFLFFSVLLLIISCGAFLIGGFWVARTHGTVQVECIQYIESPKSLQNPNRGFYQLFGFVISEQPEDYTNLLRQRIYEENGISLYQIQINLRNFRTGEISEAGLENIKSLFAALRARNKQYIIRFLYDWNGKAVETEPENIDIILLHMKQLEEVLREYKDIIFVHQGIFVGDCGEMHGSNYMSEENMRILAEQLEEVTDEETFLAVRTPAHWRKINRISELQESMFSNPDTRIRWCLYNDGMMGNLLDCGTYGTLSKSEAGELNAWNREEELAFQEKLCRYVPNGGEVIIENPVNDFESAVQAMKMMHVTYINQGYDAKVLDKWTQTIVTENSCFDGVDGLSYMERHLGYRLFIADTSASYDFWKDILTVDITLQNVGFAPLYKKHEVYLILQHEDSKTEYVYLLDGDVRHLVGGNETDKQLMLSKEISLKGYLEGEYNMYFVLKDSDSGLHIQLANEQEESEKGYLIGEIRMNAKEKLLER